MQEMAARDVRERSGSLDCAVCLTNMIDRHPRALACLHTFCQDCLRHLLDQQMGGNFLVCPTCRQHTPVPGGDIERLPVNFHLKALSSAQERWADSKLCMLCKLYAQAREASYECMECHLDLCLSCKISHEEQFEKSPHRIISRKQSIKWVGEHPGNNDTAGCEIHGNTNIEYWCSNCQSILCPMCVVDKQHAEHEIHEIGEVLQQKFEEILAQSSDNQTLSSLLTKRFQLLEEVIAKASGMKEKIAQIGNNMKSVIDYKVAIMSTICDREYIQPSTQEKRLLAERLGTLSDLEENIKKCRNVDCLSNLHDKLPVMEQQLSLLKGVPDMEKPVSMPEFIMGPFAGEIAIGAITHTYVPCKLRSSREGSGNVDPARDVLPAEKFPGKEKPLREMQSQSGEPPLTSEHQKKDSCSGKQLLCQTEKISDQKAYQRGEQQSERSYQVDSPSGEDGQQQHNASRKKKRHRHRHRSKDTGPEDAVAESVQGGALQGPHTVQRPLGKIHKAVRELDVMATNGDMQDADLVLGLPDQGALLVATANDNGERYGVLLRVNRDGHRVDRCFYSDSVIVDIILQKKKILVVEGCGRISRCWLNNLSGPPVHTYGISIRDLSGGVAISRDYLALTRHSGEIFTFRFRPRKLEVKKPGGNQAQPTHLSCDNTENQTVFAVTTEEKHQVSIYDATWRLKKSFGGLGKADGKLNRPKSSVFLPWGNLLVLDSGNNRITEFNLQGAFVRHWLKGSDQVKNPRSMSFVYPHLWVVSEFKAYRYRMFAD